MTDPIVGRAEDFTIEVLTELGAKIREDALAHITVNDEHVSQDAIELPQLIFYYNAAMARLILREEQAHLRAERAEANAYVQIKVEASSMGLKVPVDEVKARIALNPAVIQAQDEEVEIKAKRLIIHGILSAIERKGFSLQLIGQIRMREEDWLRRSFADRFANHPDRKQIASALNTVLGGNHVG